MMVWLLVGCAVTPGRVLPVVAGDAGALGPGGDLDLYLYDLDTGEARRLTQTPGVREYDPALDPSGTKVAFIAQKPGKSPGEGDYELTIHDLETGIERVYTSSSDPIYGPAWSGDGKQLAWYVQREGRFQLQVRELASPRPAEDLGYGSDPTWAGKDTLLFYSDRDRPGEGTSELCFRKLATGVVNDLGLFGTGFTNRYQDFSLLYSSLPTSRSNESVWQLDSNNVQTRLTEPGPAEHDLDPVWVHGAYLSAFTRFNSTSKSAVVLLLDPNLASQPPRAVAIDGKGVVLTRGGMQLAHPR